ncbi:MAG: DUF4474 domain-containing protein [Spirochaetales bacterium]|nr:DUF4474 domain-containing protein [Spirochaetales bacterium]
MPEWNPESEFAKVVSFAGFLYNPKYDIIYSKMNPLQRLAGYSLLYDEMAAVAISSIIDCEPIYFDYKGKKWMIEFWKGQYGIETGGEIGVYNIEPGAQVNKVINNIPDYYPIPAELKGSIIQNRKYTFYKCVPDSEMLTMSFVLHKNGEKILGRGPEKHWWLTGFKWGVMSDPKELSMQLKIQFPDEAMCKAFKGGLKRALYLCLCKSTKTSVSITFACPHYFPQPLGRYALKPVIMENNQNLVTAYNELKSQLKLPNNDPNGFKLSEINKIDGQALYQKMISHYELISQFVTGCQKIYNDNVQ